MTKPEPEQIPLHERYITFLKNQKKWIHKRELESIARKHAYTDSAINTALRKLEGEQCVGTMWQSGDEELRDRTVRVRGQYYHGYNLTDEDKAYLDRQNEGWNNT